MAGSRAGGPEALGGQLVGATIRAHQPDVAALAEVLLSDGLAPDCGLSLEQALARWWPAVAAAGTPG